MIKPENLGHQAVDLSSGKGMVYRVGHFVCSHLWMQFYHNSVKD